MPKPADPARPPAQLNMAEFCLRAAASATPDREALIFSGDPADRSAIATWTFGAIEDAVLRLASGIKRVGLRTGDRLLIRLDHHPDYALVFFGCLAAGVIPVPISGQWTADEVARALSDCGAKAAAIADGLAMPALPSGVEGLGAGDIASLIRKSERGAYATTAADDPAFLVYTSGTTAAPKGVLHAHRSAFGRIPMRAGWYGLNAHDRMLHAGALNWTFTLGTGLTDPWGMGATAILYHGPRDASIWPRLIERWGATLFAAVPGLYRQILRTDEANRSRLATLRHGLTAGEALPEALRLAWTERTRRPIYEALGQSEISTYISTGPDTPPRAGSAGRPQPGRQIAILPEDGGTEPLLPGETGLLAVHRSDPGLMLGYWNRPEEDAATRRGDWFLGGDRAYTDADGYVFHQGRADDVMNALGYRVSPAEVEEALLSHGSVAEVAVAEVTVRAGVSLIAAFIVLAAGHRLDADALKAHASQRLAAYKVPKLFQPIDALPRTSNGKVRRAALAPMVRAENSDR